MPVGRIARKAFRFDRDVHPRVDQRNPAGVIHVQDLDLVRVLHAIMSSADVTARGRSKFCRPGDTVDVDS